MKTRATIVAVFLLAVMPFGVAQPARAAEPIEVQPPAPGRILAITTLRDQVLANIVEVKPELPLGPLDVLKEYESEMTLIAQRMSSELANVTQAVQTNQITREHAEYLIQERYQVAMMQHQVLSALHDALAHDVTQAAAAAKHSGTAAASDTAVVVEPPSSGLSGTQ